MICQSLPSAMQTPAPHGFYTLTSQLVATGDSRPWRCS